MSRLMSDRSPLTYVVNPDTFGRVTKALQNGGFFVASSERRLVPAMAACAVPRREIRSIRVRTNSKNRCRSCGETPMRKISWRGGALARSEGRGSRPGPHRIGRTAVYAVMVFVTSFPNSPTRCASRSLHRWWCCHVRERDRLHRLARIHRHGGCVDIHGQLLRAARGAVVEGIVAAAVSPVPGPLAESLEVIVAVDEVPSV